MPARGIGADKAHGQHDGHHQIRLQRRQSRQPRRDAETNQGHRDIGDDDDPHHAEYQIEVLGQHFRPRHHAQPNKSHQQDRHAFATGDAKGQRRHQAAAFIGAHGRIRRNHALNRALAETLRRFRGLHRLRIGGEPGDTGANSRQYADPQSEQAGAHHQPPVTESVLHTLQHSAVLMHQRTINDRRTLDRQFHHFRHRKQADHRHRK